MSDDGRVVTAKLPDDLVSRLDEVAERIDRSKSWIVRQAVAEWLAEERRRHELTVEALRDVDEGRVLTQDDLEAWAEEQKRQKRTKTAA
jgi:predicted transcriptional regulator